MDEAKKKKCYDLFKELGINPAHKGYAYTMTAVIHKLDTELGGKKRVAIGDSYRAVAETHDCSYQNAERNIRFVAQRMFATEDSDKKLLIQDVFGTMQIVPNSQFVAALCEYLKYVWE